MIDTRHLTDKGRSSAKSRLPDGRPNATPGCLSPPRRVFREARLVLDASADAEAIYRAPSAIRLWREWFDWTGRLTRPVRP